MSAAKKESEKYAAIRGHVPKELYKQFKFFCVERGVDNSQGLEDLLREYFALVSEEALDDRNRPRKQTSRDD
jgi:hypothetical protein